MAKKTKPRHLLVTELSDRIDAVGKFLDLNDAELAALQRALLPEEFGERPQPLRPTTATPGTFAKTNVMTLRAAAGVSLHHAGDSKDAGGRAADDIHWCGVIRLRATTLRAARQEACRWCAYSELAGEVVRGLPGGVVVVQAV